MFRLHAPRPARLTVGLILLASGAATPLLTTAVASADAGTVPTATGSGSATVTGQINTSAPTSDDAAAWVNLTPVNGKGVETSVRTTGADGLRFAFTGVVPGRYQVNLSDAGGYTAHTAFGVGVSTGTVPALPVDNPSAQITVAAGQASSITPKSDVQPCLTGTVHGRAADGSLNATDSVAVQAVPGDPSLIDLQAIPPLSATTYASQNGAYRLCVPTGDYRVRFVPQKMSRSGSAVPGPDGPDYAASWEGGVQWPEQSKAIGLSSAIGPGATDTVLQAGASIAGTVSFASTDPFGYELGQLSAYAFRPATGQWDFVLSSDASGNVNTVSALLPDTYRMQWAPSQADRVSHWPTWSASTRDVEDAASLAVTPGQHRADANVTPIPRTRTVTRIAGNDRFETSAAAAEAFPSRSEDPDGRHIVFIASGTNFPDALSAGPAASALAAPLLLVQQNGLPTATKAELERLDPENVVVVGGPASVSAAVVTALKQFAPVTRLSGADRYETSRAIMRSVFVDTTSPLYAGTAQEAYIASGTRFPDALSAGAAAAQFGDPLLIVDGSASHADSATVAMTKGLDGVVGVGGPASLSTAILDDLNTNVDQFAGADRYDTAVQVNADAFEQSDTAFLAVGTNFPDALSGGAIAGAFDAPLYITPGDCVPSTVLDEFDRLDVADVELLGGPQVLSESVAALTKCS